MSRYNLSTQLSPELFVVRQNISMNLLCFEKDILLWTQVLSEWRPSKFQSESLVFFMANIYVHIFSFN